jgi:tRNA nucleotidyltransferase (CCA-adding enzyme)
VVGLLTRRAVDRAIAHNLNLTAASLMEAGEVSVRPGDSIEHLQRVMTETGWGQIPVVHPESGLIVGIVTRTDLLKTLTPQARLPSSQNLASRLESVLHPARLALLKAVAQAAHDQHAALYVVGGFVRDLLLGRPSLDFDLVVEGDAIALAHTLARRHGGRVTSHARFGTAKWHIQEESSSARLDKDFEEDPSPHLHLLPSGDLPDSLDLISARTEFYTHPTALPTVERGSIKLDLHRRDFTINTLALRLDGHHYGELHDYWGGLNDLRNGLVRVLHSLSFIDDPTRMLRAVRFEQRFGFRIEERTLELMKEAIPLLDRISGDRVRHELNHILEEENASRTLARLDELNLLQAIHPDLKWDNWLRSRLEVLPNKVPDRDWELPAKKGSSQIKRDLSYVLWMLRLEPENARAVSNRLKLSASLTSAILEACMLWRDLPDLAEAAPSVVVSRLEDVHPLARYAVYLATSDLHLRKILQTYVTRWRKIVPTINGDTLRARGLPPGPAFRTILETLRKAWLDGQVTTAEEDEVLLNKLIEELGIGDKQ